MEWHYGIVIVALLVVTALTLRWLRSKRMSPGGQPTQGAARVSEGEKHSEGSPTGWAALRSGLSRSRAALRGRVGDHPSLPELEEALLLADVGVDATARLVEAVRTRAKDGDDLWAVAAQEAEQFFRAESTALRVEPGKFGVIVVAGVNGAGKTTTIGKLAHYLKGKGHRPHVVAGDTFRAAAVEQLAGWARRADITITKGEKQSHPSAVVFDGIQQGRDLNADVVIVDTAGRLHTKAPLMEELAKVHRSAEKASGGEVCEVLLVLDATNGQNALAQAAHFVETLPVTGVVVTKMDGTAKGGALLALAQTHSVPIKLIGLGEGVEDLECFDAGSFVRELFGVCTQKSSEVATQLPANLHT